MTRFARAKGSKASNEKLPESATSWSEMKQELLNKNKELEERKNREKALQQRQANYQAFLQEKEEEEEKNVSWADFPEAQNTKIQHKTPKKRKLNTDNEDTNESKKSNSVFNKKKLKKMETSSQENGLDTDDSDEEFSALKSQIDKVLANEEIPMNEKPVDSDSDAPPEEASFKIRTEEIVVKKTKKPKQKLQILINPKGKSLVKDAALESAQKIKNNKVDAVKLNKQNLTEKEKKKIEKKQERYKKQLEKKIKVRQEQKPQKTENNNNEEQAHNTDNDRNIDLQHNSVDIDDVEAKKIRKLERRKKQKEKKLKLKQEAGLSNSLEDKRKDEVLTEKDLAKIQKKKERRARQADKRKKLREAKALAAETAETKNSELQSSISGDTKGNNLKNNGNKVFDKTNKFKEQNTEPKQDFPEKKPFQKNPNNQKEKKAKPRDKNFQRNKQKPETMFINGKSIEIDYVDGFPVKKEDADRLKKLRKEMISKGLPRSEINIALKLERRRAEKALTREKKNVCFNCRKSGHNLSECPELDKDQVAQTSGTGICFKCGSTEHTHFECKVVKGQDYKFASCFICKEQGHISRQCPDNQRGLYPKGGSCKVCGDVTHLKKDCPKYQAQQAQLQASLNVDTIDSGNPDDIGSNFQLKNGPGPVKKLNKIRF